MNNLAVNRKNCWYKLVQLYKSVNAIALNKGNDDRGYYICVLLAFMDITKLKHKADHINIIIRYDPLTDVLNISAYEHDIDLI